MGIVLDDLELPSHRMEDGAEDLSSVLIPCDGTHLKPLRSLVDKHTVMDSKVLANGVGTLASARKYPAPKSQPSIVQDG